MLTGFRSFGEVSALASLILSKFRIRDQLEQPQPFFGVITPAVFWPFMRILPE